MVGQEEPYRVWIVRLGSKRKDKSNMSYIEVKIAVDDPAGNTGTRAEHSLRYYSRDHVQSDLKAVLNALLDEYFSQYKLTCESKGE